MCFVTDLEVGRVALARPVVERPDGLEDPADAEDDPHRSRPSLPRVRVQPVQRSACDGAVSIEELAEDTAPRTLLASSRRCCKTLAAKDSHCESTRLDGAHEQAITRPLPHDELVQLHGVSAQARVTADLAGQGHDLACAA